MIVDGLLGRVKHSAVRGEFQVRVISDNHLLLRVFHVPILTTSNKQEYIDFANNILKCNFPNYQEDLQVYQLVATYQTHFH